MKKELEIKYGEGEGEERIELNGIVVLKRLNFSEKNSLEEESTDVKIYGETPQVKINTGRMKELAILKSIVSANLTKSTFVYDKQAKEIRPVTQEYPLHMDGIRALPTDVGELLFDEFSLLNTLSKKKKVELRIE